MAITSTDPTLGFLGLVIPINRYITLSESQNSFVQAPNPGPTPPNPEGLTAFQIAENVRQYRVAREDRKTFCKFQIILVSMITNNCPGKYLTTLKNPITKFCRGTPLQILQHLWTKYGTISSQDLTANYTAMAAKWNPPTPIEDLFLQLRDGQEFATDGNESISNSQLLRLCYDNVNSTGLFNDALKIWRAKAQADKRIHCSALT